MGILDDIITSIEEPKDNDPETKPVDPATPHAAVVTPQVDAQPKPEDQKSSWFGSQFIEVYGSKK